jgi:hypothetical protein
VIDFNRCRNISTDLTRKAAATEKENQFVSLKFKSLTQRQVNHLIKNTAARLDHNNKDKKPSKQVTTTRSIR